MLDRVPQRVRKLPARENYPSDLGAVRRGPFSEASIRRAADPFGPRPNVGTAQHMQEAGEERLIRIDASAVSRNDEARGRNLDAAAPDRFELHSSGRRVGLTQPKLMNRVRDRNRAHEIEAEAAHG